MKISGFDLNIIENSNLKNISEDNNNYFRLNLSEQKNGNAAVISGTITSKCTLNLHSLNVYFSFKLEGATYYSNGFQSWSESPQTNSHTRLRKLAYLPGNLFQLKKFGDYTFNSIAFSKGASYSHLYLDLHKEGTAALFLGDLLPHDSYTMFSVDYTKNTITACSDLEGIILNNGESREIFKICAVPDKSLWFNLLEFERLPAPKLTGWTSWYNYYTQISESILKANMKAINEAGIPIDVFQIDDGYFTHIGDWLEPNERFSGGMKAVADSIVNYGWTPGIWSAPFITDKSSAIFQKHIDWVKRTPTGKLQSAGWNYNWTGVFYALDIYNEEFREYLRQVYNTQINEWGFQFLKLDFLYAAGLQPANGKTRCAVMSNAMDFLLEVTQGAKILACGAPIGPASGKCHYCRIGGDISHMWEDKILKAIHYRERVDTASSLGNTLSRAFMNEKLFMNDPDVFILRDTKEIKMSREQRMQLFKTNMNNSGLVFFSDDVSMYPENDREMVKKAFMEYKTENFTDSQKGPQ